MSQLTETPGEVVSLKATGAIAAERLISVAGGYATSPAKSLGISVYSAAASGDELAVYTDGVVRVTAGAAITAGAEIEAGTNGKAVTLSSGKSCGLAVTAAAADGDVILARIPA